MFVLLSLGSAQTNVVGDAVLSADSVALISLWEVPINAFIRKRVFILRSSLVIRESPFVIHKSAVSNS
jgi:hypothetical protein